MDPITIMIIGSIIAGLANAGTNIYTANAQKEAQREANETNIMLAREQNEAQLQQVRETNAFNAAQAQIDRDRQDTTMQRAMADYSAAGLNPLLALGSSTASYAAPAAASGNVAKIERAHVNPAYLDFSGMASAFSSMSNAMLTAALVGNNKNMLADKYLAVQKYGIDRKASAYENVNFNNYYKYAKNFAWIHDYLKNSK